MGRKHPCKIKENNMESPEETTFHAKDHSVDKQKFSL